VARNGARPVPVARRYRLRPSRRFVEEERAGRLAAYEDAVADRKMPQARGERAVLNLDREELEFLGIVGGGDGIGPHERTALDVEPEHHELPVLEPAGGVAGRPETEQGVRPVADVENSFLEQRAHSFPGEKIVCLLTIVHCMSRVPINAADDRTPAAISRLPRGAVRLPFVC
jgi:hypothetical protein